MYRTENPVLFFVVLSFHVVGMRLRRFLFRSGGGCPSTGSSIVDWGMQCIQNWHHMLQSASIQAV